MKVVGRRNDRKVRVRVIMQGRMGLSQQSSRKEDGGGEDGSEFKYAQECSR